MSSHKVVKALFFLLVFLIASPVAFAPTQGSFDLSQATYYDNVKNVFSLTSEQEEMLQRSGFVVVEPTTNKSECGDYDWLCSDLRFEDFYFSKVYRNDLPVFVTTDSMLHLFHVVFDSSLKILEKELLYPMILEITQFALNSSLQDYMSLTPDGSMTYWAFRNSTIYFAVAFSLLTGNTTELPEELSEDVDFFLDEIYAGTPRFLSAGMWNFPEPPFSVEVKYDFTQFTVRGHYLGDITLERYFRTLMWYGRFPIFVQRNDEDWRWKIQFMSEPAMVYMRDVLASNPQYYQNWLLVYNVTSALVGESDSLNLLNLELALQNIFGEADTYLNYIAADGGLAAFRDEVSNTEYLQRILSQALIASPPGIALARYPIVFHFMGQRFIPDSYLFQNLCWDKVGFSSTGERRILPKGLDVFAVLGSERAYQLLIPDFKYSGFQEHLENLTTTFKNMKENDWLASSYTAWLYTLTSLVNITYSEEYPAFMQTLTWQDEKLNTALGSWAQLRHDTILYAKQTYIPGFLCSYPEAFVEPNPLFYSRMQRLVEQTIEAINILEPYGVKPRITTSLNILQEITQKLGSISEKELAKEPLTSEEIQFIKKIVWNCGSGGPIGWYLNTIRYIAYTADSSSLLEAPVIADVATFPPGDIQYPPQILHVGVGHINALIVLFPTIDGTLVTAVGPVFSYYEFPMVGTKRLNDNEWKTMLSGSNRTHYTPEWFQDVYGRAEPWPIPEFSNIVMVLVLVLLPVTILVFTRIPRERIKKLKWKTQT